MTKINKISLKNFRGARAQVELLLKNGQSALIYGNNGTGKSSFADAIEWLTTDKISHLNGEEIEPHGGIRNTLSTESEDCFVEINFTKPSGSAEKSLTVDKGKLKAVLATSTAAVGSYVSELEKERIILRGSTLVEFVLATKTKRLEQISSIIGFDAVVDTKTFLKKGLADLKAIIKNKSFQDALAAEKKVLAEQLNGLVNDQEQFVVACNKLVATLQLDMKVLKITDLETIEAKLKEGVDQKQTQLLGKLESLRTSAESMLTDFKDAQLKWEKFDTQAGKLIANSDRLKKVNLARLLDEAKKILSSHTTDDCPLCLQKISRADLIKTIQDRITELKTLNEEVQATEALKKTSCNKINEVLEKFRTFYIDAQALGEEPSLIDLASFGKQLREAVAHVIVTDSVKIVLKPSWIDLPKIEEIVRNFVLKASVKVDHLKKTLNSPRVEVAAKLAVAKKSFERIQSLQKELEVLSAQQDTMEKLVSEFNRRQKEGMETFLDAISVDINELYLFMNAEEKIDEIKLKCLADQKTAEFSGIALSLKFHGQEVGSPKKFLSESHLNCLGLCLFLASVKKFNKMASFFVLDDVISSFDKNHRIRFGQLLAERFKDYQLIVLTHETEWFDFLSTTVKGIGWTVQRTLWNSEEGIRLEAPFTGVKEQIEHHISANNENDLGNAVRRYSERLLKEIAEQLEVPMPFRFNERNEARMFDELYSCLKGRIGKKTPTLATQAEFMRLGTCQFLSNKGSHDNSYKPNIADMKIAYADVQAFESLFHCIECKKFVSLHYQNVSGGSITCKCGKKTMGWK